VFIAVRIRGYVLLYEMVVWCCRFWVVEIWCGLIL